MDFPFLPKRLVTGCNRIIEQQYKQGIQSNLMKTLTEKHTMVFILVHDDLRGMLGASVACWRFAILCFAACAVAFLLSLFISWWIALTIVPLLVGARYLLKKANGFNVTIAAVLLTLEMMASGFAGLSRHWPKECQDAREKIDKYFPIYKTRFMDLYFPRRDEVGTEEFAGRLTQLFESEKEAVDRSA
jgi:hypothetical protein